MTEQKAKPVTRTMETAKAVSAVASKPNTTKAGGTTATSAPVMKKPEAEKSTVKSAVVAAARPAATHKTTTEPTPEERYRMVGTAAYLIAEQHCFQGGSGEHWAEAERRLNL
ncbi:MAG: DUF2934 domain-containing protein [Gallionella sp.]|nr:DUF2934 domain-containing protein [Gallionella sp.]